MGRRLLGALIIALLALVIGAAPAGAATPWLHVEGNLIKDPAGRPVTLRGVSVIAPEQAFECRTCKAKPTPAMIDMTVSDGWRSRVVRLPITTKYSKDPRELFARYIDPNVRHATARGLYVIVDLHLVSDYDIVPQAQLIAFWTFVARQYRNAPNVLFEVFNEPIKPDNWPTWKAYIQPVVDAIRSTGAQNLVLVGGPSWSTRVNEASRDPLRGPNIVYVYHIYPNQGPASLENLDARFGDAARRIPVMITEFGWGPEGKYADDVAVGATSQWGRPFRRYLDARPHIGWVGWIFDNFWKPTYFDEDWNLLGGEHHGAFVKDWLADMQAAGQPGGAANPPPK